jgi:hypothetical protein
MKIRPVGAELFRADGWADRHDEAIVEFRNFAFKSIYSLTITGPCTADIFSEYNQQDATFLVFIYFCKMLYMFQTAFPSIIRSTKLHIEPARLAAGSSKGLTNS